MWVLEGNRLVTIGVSDNGIAILYLRRNTVLRSLIGSNIRCL